jgi:hypothetical protein
MISEKINHHSQVQQQEIYEPPAAEVADIEIEKGFANSSDGWDNGGGW